MKTTSMTIKEKKALLGILENLYDDLEREENYARKEYKQVGVSDEPLRDRDTGEIKVDEDGNTLYKAIYDYVTKPEDELSDRDKAIIKAIGIVRESLDALI